MASLLALLSSAMWGTADFFAGRLSKKHHPFAVLGFSQVIGLFVGVLVLLVSGNWEGKVLGFNGFLIPGVLAGLLAMSDLHVCMKDYQRAVWELSHRLVL